MPRPFAHLHLHTQYSLLDGAIQHKALFARARALGKTVEGHTAGARAPRLVACPAAGLDSCHEPITAGEALERLRHFPYEDLGFAKLDHHRGLRNGFPEVVLGEVVEDEGLTLDGLTDEPLSEDEPLAVGDDAAGRPVAR